MSSIAKNVRALLHSSVRSGRGVIPTTPLRDLQDVNSDTLYAIQQIQVAKTLNRKIQIIAEYVASPNSEVEWIESMLVGVQGVATQVYLTSPRYMSTGEPSDASVFMKEMLTNTEDIQHFIGWWRQVEIAVDFSDVFIAHMKPVIANYKLWLDTRAQIEQSTQDTMGYHNVGIGMSAAQSMTLGNNNIVVGYQTLCSHTVISSEDDE
jgi:hypothetical protein